LETIYNSVIINAFVGAMVGMERSIFQNLLKLNLEWLPNSYSIIYSSIQLLKPRTISPEISQSIWEKNLLLFGWF
jgi:hypothetical protein